MAEITIRDYIAELVFFEGLRQMVGNRYGLRCPMRSFQWSEQRYPDLGDKKTPPKCCGRVDELVKLWEVGNQAAKKFGFSFRKWEMPMECLRRSRASA